MLIEIHMIQNHSPANLNRDDLGAPKTCYFGGVLRSRISSQCLKRSIRTSEDFRRLLGAVRTRRLAQLIATQETDLKQLFENPSGARPSYDEGTFARAMEILKACGIAPKDKKGKESADEDKSAGVVYVTRDAIFEMRGILESQRNAAKKELARRFAEIIAQDKSSPDMALCGRMLEAKKDKGKGAEEASKPDNVWKGLDTTVEAALQVAHAISTHEARPEVDYYTTKDDVPGEDEGAGFVGEAMFASACFYKYFSINWKTLVKNLEPYGEPHKKLAAHTVGAFLRGAARVNPSGKQNSCAAHNFPDGVMVEIRDYPVSYANAFARPVRVDASIKEDGRDVVSQSIAQLGQYVYDIEKGYDKPSRRFWFSPNLRYPLEVTIKEEKDGKQRERQEQLTDNNLKSLDELVPAVIGAIGYDWEEVKRTVVNPEVSDERKHAAASA